MTTGLIKNFSLLPDIPVYDGQSKIEGDKIGFDGYARILASAAFNTEEPITIGVYGDWGSGKTSLMRMMEKKLRDAGATTVWFNAWQYEKEDHLVIPLLATIIKALEEKEKAAGKTKAKPGSVLKAFRSLLYGIAIKPPLVELDAGKAIDKFEDLSQTEADKIAARSLYFNTFEGLREAAEGSDSKIVVFVDDLDRCFPIQAVKLIESIKLVLHQRNIAFVLGLEPEIIKAFLRHKYTERLKIPEELYGNYLDKIVQMPFKIPPITKRVKDYVKQLLEMEIFGKIAGEDIEALCETICPACRENPRKIIRFLNRLLVMREVAEIEEGDKGDKGELKIAPFAVHEALSMMWPEILSILEENDPVVITDSLMKDFGVTDNCISLSLYLAKLMDGENNLIGLFEAEISVDHKKPHKAVLEKLLVDKRLLDLLSSGPGKEWLSDPDTRKRIKESSEEVLATGEEEQHWPEINGHVIKPGAYLVGAYLARANLARTNLAGANLSGANLHMVNLYVAGLEATNLFGADLSGANLYGANLSGANLYGANLYGANLFGANLSGANLYEADLRMANLSYANLTNAILDGAIIDKTTKLDGAIRTGTILDKSKPE